MIVSRFPLDHAKVSVTESSNKNRETKRKPQNLGHFSFEIKNPEENQVPDHKDKFLVCL